MSAASGERRVVIFDMGNVLIDWNPDQIYQNHIADDQERALFFVGLFRRMHQAVHDSDGSFTDALQGLKQDEPGSTALIEQFEHGWHEFLHGPMGSSVAVLEALVAAKVPLYGLTNWPHQTWPPKNAISSDHDYGFLQHFEDVVVSGQVKMHKPDEDIYDYALARFGVRPEEAVFVDDLLENIETANRLGLHGIQFSDATSLHLELVKLGLLEA